MFLSAGGGRFARPRLRGAARHSKTGFDSDKRNARGYSWSSSVPSGSGSARYLGFQLRLSRPTGQQNALWARFSVALPPEIGMTLGTRRLQLALQRPLASTEKLQFESNRAQRARESPPPHAARGAARHSKTRLFSAKLRWRRLAPLAEPAAPHIKKIRPCAHPPRRFAPGRQGRAILRIAKLLDPSSARPSFLRVAASGKSYELR